MLFLLPYLLSCIFLGIALSTLFRYRENSLLLLMITSIPFLMLSGASIPKECMPEWLYAIGKVVPSSSGVDGVRANPDDGGHAIRGFRAVVHAVGIDGGLFRLGLPGYAQYHPARGEPTGVTIRPVYCRVLNDQSS